MCGIIGARVLPGSEVSAQDVERGIELLAHRGPDAKGLRAIPTGAAPICLGHTRLSILDLSSAGHQPMTSSDGRLVLVFNGEIYNFIELRGELRALGYQFRSSSDTEVLLAAWSAWGERCLRRLTGMFAFAIYDSQTGEIACARDAFGIKPLYYHFSKKIGFVFASEPAALAAILPSAGLNANRAMEYLLSGTYDNDEETFYSGIKQLPSGHSLKQVGDEEPTLKRWWNPSLKESSLSFKDAADQMREMFLDSVRLHLRSDVPIGAALSGGLDSSAVVCAMRYLEPAVPIHTFTYVARQADINEERWADAVNEHVKASPCKLDVDEAELSADLIDLVRTQGEPFGGTSIYAQYRVYKLAKDKGVTVVLDGQGADELLAGYSGYPGPRMLSLIERGEFLEAWKFIREWSKWPGRSLSAGVRSTLRSMAPEGVLMSQHLRARPRWMSRDAFHAHHQARQIASGRAVDQRGRRVVGALHRAITREGLGALLRHGDRNSMRWAVESRVPFLTPAFAEFALSLPENYLISDNGETKNIFREAMRGIVPAAVLARKDKVGFATPQLSWLSANASTLLKTLEAAEALPFIQIDACRAEVMAVLAGRSTDVARAWRLINFCLWFSLR